MSPASSPRGWLRGAARTTILALALALSGACQATALAPASTGELRYGPPSATQAWVAKVLYPVIARSAPSPQAHGLLTVAPVSSWGTPTELLVIGAHREATGRLWVRVRLDYRPNGFAAWIDATGTIVHRDLWRISVSRRQREVRVYRAGHLVRSFAAVIGKTSTPTPVGLFAVAAELAQPNPGEFVGSWVIPLTAHSGVLRHFDGGDGQIALHGRDGASLLDPLGSARSHGCVRLDNVAIDWIATHVALGTPVRVS